MNRNSMRRLTRRLPKNNQKGFTLIELLVVISIIGILAAVVTMSLVGFTTIANQRAADAEKGAVQTAYDTMLADQGVDPLKACPGGAGGGTQPTGQGNTNQDMQAFPTSAPWEDQKVPSSTVHDPKQLYPRYLRQQKTHGWYHCVTGEPGTIVQDIYNP